MPRGKTLGHVPVFDPVCMNRGTPLPGAQGTGTSRLIQIWII